MAGNRLEARMSLAGHTTEASAEGVGEYDWNWRTSGNFVNTFQVATDVAAALDVSGLTMDGATILIKNHSNVANVSVSNETDTFAVIPPNRGMLFPNGANDVKVTASGGGDTAEIEILLVEE